jgi:3'-phosphoadenosine 5'-phosphosulfate sulfotransferase (PAPS reductase)/FAD synthetase
MQNQKTVTEDFGSTLCSVVSFGGGVNSTAMLIGMILRGERPDAILFADTGGEKPATYDFVATFRDWLTKHDLKLANRGWRDASREIRVVSSNERFDYELERKKKKSLLLGRNVGKSKPSNRGKDPHKSMVLVDVEVRNGKGMVHFTGSAAS